MNQKVITGELEHPEMRGSLVTILFRLSNKLYQEQYWCEAKANHFFWDNLKMVRNFLFYDIMLGEDVEGEEGYRPIDQIGYSLRSYEEYHIVMRVIFALQKLLNEIGIEKPDSAYLDSPLWEELIQASSVAFQYIKNQGLDEKYVEWAEAPRKEKE